MRVVLSCGHGWRHANIPLVAMVLTFIRRRRHALGVLDPAGRANGDVLLGVGTVLVCSEAFHAALGVGGATLLQGPASSGASHRALSRGAVLPGKNRGNVFVTFLGGAAILGLHANHVGEDEPGYVPWWTKVCF